MFTNSNTDNNSDFSDTEENNMRNFTVNIKESNLFPIDNLFINLKVFSKIQKNDKLIINDSILQVDDRYLQSLRRWLSNDDRIRVVEHILKIYNDSFKYYNYADNNYILPSDISIENNNDFKNRLMCEIKNSIIGLKNIKYTYREDSVMASKLDLLIDKSTIYINRNNNK
jgi:hypothetical protein